MVDAGFVRKGKMRSGRMVYRLVGEVSPVSQEIEDNDE